MGKYYLTTPIYYVNDRPHIGHAYTTIVADTIKRWQRCKGNEPWLVTGTDENSQKNIEAAQKAGVEDIQTYLNGMADVWRATWNDLDIGVDDFIRTTEDRHKKGVEQFWNTVYATGDIYQGAYEGLYCTGCEAFYKETDLVDGNCPMHKKPVTTLKEKNWFFRLSAYREKLLAHIDANPDFVQPASRRNEIRSYIEKFMEDVSISRETMKWGIPVPNDPHSVIYVWFDALLNYLTAVGYGTDEAMFAKEWPADLHLVGKDIIKFHCALWPAMLMAAGLPLPKRVFAHGFFTINGEKISKSLGNAIDPLALTAEVGIDPVRYYLLREIPFGEDGDFSVERLHARTNGELGNALGNGFYRVLSMTEKYADGKIPAAADAGNMGVAETWESYATAMDGFAFHHAVESVMALAAAVNADIDTVKPWALAKVDADAVRPHLYRWLETFRHIALMLVPMLPATSANMLKQLGEPTNDRDWGCLREGTTLAKGDPLFPRLEAKAL